MPDPEDQPAIPEQDPANVLVESFNRSWSDAFVEVTAYSAEGYVMARLPHENQLRLSILLEEVGRVKCEPRERAHVPCKIEVKPRDLSLIPAGMELFGYSPDVRYVKVAHVVFNTEAFRDRLQLSGNLDLATTPRLRFADDRLWTLAKLLTDAIENDDPTSQLYGDSLVTAIGAGLLEGSKPDAKPVAGLSKIQLSDALSFLDANMPNRVELSTMANLAGLSQSHYCRAFKASTGMAPYQWQPYKRIERAKCLLLDTRRSLNEIAEETGFADAVHFGRTFRKLTGVPPASWRTDRLT